MRELAKDERDFVSEEGRGVVEAAGEGVHSGDCGRQIGRRGEVAESEHGTVALEEREGGV